MIFKLKQLNETNFDRSKKKKVDRSEFTLLFFYHGKNQNYYAICTCTDTVEGRVVAEVPTHRTKETHDKNDNPIHPLSSFIFSAI